MALCFMSYTLGLDLGVVMAKGVVLGVTGRFPVFLVLFVIILILAYSGYQQANKEIYYNLGDTLPEDMAYVIANSKLEELFGVGATHMVLVNADTSAKDVKAMIAEMEQVEGMKYVLGMESVVGSLVPEEMIPESVSEVLRSDEWELLLANSEYKTATDEVNVQIDELNNILKRYDAGGMLIGEAPCTKDLIEITDLDFKTVNAISIIAIFVIIALVEKSITLPFIAPICISTIQLGATVDYAILMTTRYKEERYAGKGKREAVSSALGNSIPSIIVSAMGLFSVTFDVALYSEIDIIKALCNLLARGAVVSMFSVILVLPSMFMIFDKVICVTSVGFRKKEKRIRRNLTVEAG